MCPRLGSSSLVAFVSLGGGCLYVAPVWKETPKEYVCPDETCEITLFLDMEDILACYPDLNTLPDVLAPCAAFVAASECPLNLGTFTYNRGVETCCDNEDDAFACCELSEYALNEASDAGLNEAFEEINADCAIGQTQLATVTECEYVWEDPNQPGVLPDYGDCDELDPFGADQFEFLIDPALSYVVVNYAGSQIVSSLDGNGFSAADPQEVLVAFAEGEDFYAVGDAFTQLVVVLSADVELNGNGNTYTVPTNQAFEMYFQGLRDGDQFRVDFAPSVSSGGTFDVGEGEWSYNYYRSAGGTTIDVHMEGGLSAVSP